MESFEVHPIFGSALADVAGFLHRWRETEAARTAVPKRVRESAVRIEQRLRWLLVDNPVAAPEAPVGYCIRDTAGNVRGMNLCFPAAYMAGDQRLMGLGSGSFFVEEPARSLGFYLFKKYLGTPGYSFYFSTTCNANSSQLWSSLGGRAVPDSENEYVVPLRLDGVMAGIVAGKTPNPIAAGIARVAGLVANPVLRLQWGRRAGASGLTLQPCRDWEKLSELSRRNHCHGHIDSDRSVGFLEWRYGPVSPLQGAEIYLFRDQQGREGWFSLAGLIRGAQSQFRGAVLLDVIWPRQEMDFGRILQAILGRAQAGAEAMFLRSQPRVDYRAFHRLAFPYRLGAPRAYVKSAKGAPPMNLDLLDYDDSDYGAWRFAWAGTDSATGDEPLAIKESV